MNLSKKLKPKSVHLSEYALCATERDCFTTYKKGVAARRLFIATTRLFVGYLTATRTEPRVFGLVKIRLSGALRLRLMDAITGTLYEPKTGRCMSSDGVRLFEAKEEQKRGGDMLRAFKMPELLGGEW